MKKPNVHFKFPKKNDIDKVPSQSIVKKIDLIEDATLKDKVYFIKNNDDQLVYFT